MINGAGRASPVLEAEWNGTGHEGTGSDRSTYLHRSGGTVECDAVLCCTLGFAPRRRAEREVR